MQILFHFYRLCPIVKFKAPAFLHVFIPSILRCSKFKLFYGILRVCLLVSCMCGFFPFNVTNIKWSSHVTIPLCGFLWKTNVMYNLAKWLFYCNFFNVIFKWLKFSDCLLKKRKIYKHDPIWIPHTWFCFMYSAEPHVRINLQLQSSVWVMLAKNNCDQLL